MDIEKSRNGFYTITFLNKNNVDEKVILKDFSTVGNVCKIVQNFQRVFIRFKEKEEAKRALIKFKNIYDVDMAKNNKNSENQQEGLFFNSGNHTHNYINNHNHKSLSNHTGPAVVLLPEMSSSNRSLEKLNPASNKVYHLILGSLPKNYTIKDVTALVEEAKPVCINQLDETRVFNIKFCHIVLSSAENLAYLIDKLNGFVISGEKLIAAEAKHLLEWSEKTI